jgi:1-acyl-sn-glycerol-3-phosphate acyltransferase
MSVARRLARAVARRHVARGLDGVWVRGLDQARDTLARGPVVFAATHVAWWDGLVVSVVDDALGGDGRAWVDATNLGRVAFLRALGGLPVHRGDPSRLRADLRTAAAHLDRPGRSLWIFPQGAQRPAWWRPLGVSGGAAAVARLAGATILPVALTYVFREAPVPGAYLDVGRPVVGDGLEPALVEGLGRIDAFVATGAPPFEPVVASRARRVDERWPSRLLGAVSRG